MSFFNKLAERLELDDLDKHDKVAFVILACAGVIIVVLWVMQLQKSIVNPLYGGVNPNTLKQTTAQTSTTTTDESLKNQDTDKDGLSDWDELNIYKTSPYLADSDSDGISDFDEIKKGTDPNCPTGQNCTGASSQDTTTTTTVTPNFENSDLSNLLNQTTTETVTPQISPTTSPATGTNNSNAPLTAEEKDALKKIIGSSKDPAVLRNFLLASGSDKTYVDSLSDKDLQKVIDEILQ